MYQYDQYIKKTFKPKAS
jgi:hypothetical protein